MDVGNNTSGRTRQIHRLAQRLDEFGVPTHDDDGVPLSLNLRLSVLGSAWVANAEARAEADLLAATLAGLIDALGGEDDKPDAAAIGKWVDRGIAVLEGRR